MNAGPADTARASVGQSAAQTVARVREVHVTPLRKNRRNDAVILRSTLLHPNLPLRKRNAASEGTDPKRQRTNDNGTSTRKYNKAKLGAKQ